jgi:hypothetical protein
MGGISVFSVLLTGVSSPPSLVVFVRALPPAADAVEKVGDSGEG